MSIWMIGNKLMMGTAYYVVKNCPRLLKNNEEKIDEYCERSVNICRS